MIFDHIGNFFFPHTCVSCGKEGEVLCKDCLVLVPNTFREASLPNCFTSFNFKDLWLRRSLHALKYGGLVSIADNLVSYAVTNPFFHERMRFLDEVVWIPVPISLRRRKERGYNQAEKIAHVLQKHFGGTVLNTIVKKRDQKSLVGTDRNERFTAMQGAFSVGECSLSKKSKIIIVDDLVTTGATLLSVTSALKERGFGVQFCYTVACEY
jgi:ComF family protein